MTRTNRQLITKMPLISQPLLTSRHPPFSLLTPPHPPTPLHPSPPLYSSLCFSKNSIKFRPFYKYQSIKKKEREDEGDPAHSGGAMREPDRRQVLGGGVRRARDRRQGELRGRLARTAREAQRLLQRGQRRPIRAPCRAHGS